MQMLYDSDSFVVMHLQAEPQLQAGAQDAVLVAMQGIPLDGMAQTHAPENALPQYRLARHGFEIVDKRSGKEVYLDGSWAELFQQQISAWQVKTPTQEEVEETLERYAQLAQNPVVLH
jgi:UDP-N-acetyl-D-mannosaminuronic acid transferase (WecB/TagA/CpsF family)